MADRTCTLPDCFGPHKAKGFCNPHYLRFRKFGDPKGVGPRGPYRVSPHNKILPDPSRPGFLPCTGCGEHKPEEDFSYSSETPHRNYRAHRCRPCRKLYEDARYARDAEKVKERVRWAQFKFKYRLIRSQYEARVAERGGLCDICKQPDPDRRLCVDHDHSCCPTEKTCGGCLRGLLCNRCNRLIGLARDNPAALETAAAYLRSWVRSP